MKVKKNPWTALFPCPVVLVSCIDSNLVPNIITLAWVGIACSDPPTLSLGIRANRLSYKLIDTSKDCVVNIPTVDLLEETDFCGMVSGRDVNKFSEMNLTSKIAEKVKSPLIQECPVNIECLVNQKIPIGTHHLFLCEIVCVHVDEDKLNEKGKLDFQK